MKNDKIPALESETRKNGVFIAENAISPANPHKIEDWKLDFYRKVWRTMKARQGDDYPLSYRVPCPSEFCREPLFAVTLGEIEAIGKGELVCEFCRDNGGKSKRLADFERACPKAFREGATATKPEKLKNLKKISIYWPESVPESSLFVYGETGTQKSRTLFHLLRERTLPSRASYRVLGGGEFRELFLSVSGDYGRVNDLKKHLTDLDFLIFDDFAQDVLTDAMLGDLWSVLDKRFRDNKATVFLSNISAMGISERYGESHTMKSLIRRIRDFCKIINF